MSSNPIYQQPLPSYERCGRSGNGCSNVHIALPLLPIWEFGWHQWITLRSEVQNCNKCNKNFHSTLTLFSTYAVMKSVYDITSCLEIVQYEANPTSLDGWMRYRTRNQFANTQINASSANELHAVSKFMCPRHTCFQSLLSGIYASTNHPFKRNANLINIQP